MENNDKEFQRGLNKAKYKSAGPLKSNNININVYGDKEKTILLFRIGLSNYYNVHKPQLEDCDIYVDVPKPADFMKFQKIIDQNPDIKSQEVYDWIDKIVNHRSWLQCVYKPKFSKINQFFYQVYLWVKGDIDLFCLYSGAYAEIKYVEQYNENYDDVDIQRTIIIKHEHNI